MAITPGQDSTKRARRAITCITSNSSRYRSSGLHNDTQGLDKSPAATDERHGPTDERRHAPGGRRPDGRPQAAGIECQAEGDQAAGPRRKATRRPIHPPYPCTARRSASPTESVFYFLPPLTAQRATLHAPTLAHSCPPPNVQCAARTVQCAARTAPRSTPLPLHIAARRP